MSMNDSLNNAFLIFLFIIRAEVKVISIVVVQNSIIFIHHKIHILRHGQLVTLSCARCVTLRHLEENHTKKGTKIEEKVLLASIIN